MVWAERLEALSALAILFAMMASFTPYPGQGYTVRTHHAFAACATHAPAVADPPTAALLHCV